MADEPDLATRVAVLEVALALVMSVLPEETQAALRQLRLDLHDGDEMDRRGIPRSLSLPLDDAFLRAGLRGP